jgi:polar amino acid transport system substrate-binding protein
MVLTRRSFTLGTAGSLITPAMSQAWAQNRPTLKMVFFNFAPFYWVEGNQPPQGLYIELFNQMAERAGFRPEVQELPTARARAALIDGSADVMLTNNTAPELQGKILSSPEPIDRLITEAYAIGSDPGIRSQADLAGKSVIMQQRFSHGGLRGFVDTAANQVTVAGEAPNPIAGLRMLLAGRAPIYIQYRNLFDSAVREVRPTADIKRSTINEIPVFINVTRARPDAQQVLDQLVRAVTELRQEGRFTPTA